MKDHDCAWAGWNQGGKRREGTKGPKLPLDATMARDSVSIAPRAAVENTSDDRATFSSIYFFDHKHRER
jgi:hypothetical protein